MTCSQSIMAASEKEEPALGGEVDDSSREIKPWGKHRYP